MEELKEALEQAISNQEKNSDVLLKIKKDIIKCKSAELAYLYAMEFEDEDSSLQKLVIKQNEAHYIYLFARDVFNADISKLENAILKTENIEERNNFANYVEGANRKKLLKKTKQMEEN